MVGEIPEHSRSAHLHKGIDGRSEEERLSYENELAALAQAKKQVEEYIFRNNTQTRNIIEEVDREVVGVEGSFIFLKKNLGKPIKITYSE